MTLFRGGQTVWLNEKDAAEIGVRDNDWCEVYNRNGVVISPEFRTLPMVWYIPPLSPIAKKFEDKVYLPNSEAMRIPVKYLAELFTAGYVCPRGFC